MATKASKNRYRTIRSVIASASVLSFLPLLTLMRGGGAGDSLASAASPEATVSQDAVMAVANTQAASTAATVSTQNSVATVAATPVATGQSSQTSTTTATKTSTSSTKTQSASTYTRTKAS